MRICLVVKPVADLAFAASTLQSSLSAFLKKGKRRMARGKGGAYNRLSIPNVARSSGETPTESRVIAVLNSPSL